MSERFTVFGADGFIGGRLAEELERTNCSVFRPPRDWNAESQDDDLGHVIYCIGVTGSDFHREQFNVVEGHVSLMAKALEHCSFSSFTYLSTTRTFARSQFGELGRRDFLVDPLDPSDFYNLSKLLGEALVLNCGKPRARVVRLSYVVDFAPDSTDEVSRLIRAAQQGSVVFNSHPETMKNYVLIRDVISVLPNIAVSGQQRVYEIGGGVNVSMHQIGDVLMRVMGCEVSYERGAGKRSMGVVDIRALQQEFDFSPTPLLDYLDEVAKKHS